MSTPEGPGSLGEEATRLVGALQQWLGGGYGKPEVTDDVWSQATADSGEHLAGQAPECTVCPICRSIRFVRALDPQAVDQFVDAATAMLAALRDARRKADPPNPARREPQPGEETWD